MHFPTKNIGGNFLCGKLGGGANFSRHSFLNDSLSLTKFCNLNVVCPDLSHLDHHICARPQGVLEICAIVQLKTVPTLPPLPHPLPPRSLSNDISVVTISLCSSPLPRPPHSPHLPPPWRPKRVNIWYSFSTRPQPPPSHPSPWVHSSPWSYRRQGSWVLIWFHSCYCLLLLLPTFIWVDLMRRWTDNLMTRWGDLSAIPPQEFRRSTGAFASSAMKSARSCSEYICHSANKCLQG